MSFTVIGGCIVIGFALINDPKGAAKYVVAIITVRGVAWLCTKITAINKDASEIINFAGWSLAGVSIVGLLKLAIKGLPEIIEGYTKAIETVNKAIEWIDHLPIIGGK
jgi:hypothetical protein